MFFVVSRGLLSVIRVRKMHAQNCVAGVDVQISKLAQSSCRRKVSRDTEDESVVFMGDHEDDPLEYDGFQTFDSIDDLEMHDKFSSRRIDEGSAEPFRRSNFVEGGILPTPASGSRFNNRQTRKAG